MLMEPRPADQREPDVLDRLRQLCTQRGLTGLAENLAELGHLVQMDMASIEAELSQIESGESLAERAAAQLMEAGGKRLRPMCVALASRVGSGFDQRALDLAVSVELVHNATLLHDDVIDLAATRRGLPTARSEYGNAASIFGGDWLLVEALRRVHRAAVGDTFPRLLDTIETMIRAESLQLEQRGSLATSEATYFRIVEGKSAVLFSWALYAGARVGGLGDADSMALEEFGTHLGVAFQLVDDLLDFTGDQRRTGKALFIDLREGKMTYPLIVASARDPELRPLLHRIMDTQRNDSTPLEPMLASSLLRRLEASGALEDSRLMASQRVDAASSALGRLSQQGNRAVSALGLVAQSTLHRDR